MLSITPHITPGLLQTSSSSSAFPAVSLGFTMFGEIFAYVIALGCLGFFYPTREVATSPLHGWCMLGVFLWSAFTRLGLNVRIFWICAVECVCAQTRPWFIVSSERVSGNGVRTCVNSKWKIPSSRGSEEGQTYSNASCRTVRTYDLIFTVTEDLSMGP